ncbi:polyprotein [Frankliniella fusca]|uniref:Polyprotein n=1 Tax=Frankliniella fusca TaxID=407009 RepID=A0AAE1HG47_9NEOP|nr:polyprotein [Frankliniella fusca]
MSDALRVRTRQLVKYYVTMKLLARVTGRNLAIGEWNKLKAILLFYLFKEENIRLRQLWLLAHRRPRRWRVRPMLQERQIYGAWHTLVPLLRETDPEEYFNFLRMTPESFDWLLDKVGPVIIKQQSKRSLSEYISPGERLAVTLRFLASGDSQTSLSYLFRISTQAISNIVTETTAAIWFALKKEVFEPISPEFWRRKYVGVEADLPAVLLQVGVEADLPEVPLHGVAVCLLAVRHQVAVVVPVCPEEIVGDVAVGPAGTHRHVQPPLGTVVRLLTVTFRTNLAFFSREKPTMGASSTYP